MFWRIRIRLEPVILEDSDPVFRKRVGSGLNIILIFYVNSIRCDLDPVFSSKIGSGSELTPLGSPTLHLRLDFPFLKYEKGTIKTVLRGFSISIRRKLKEKYRKAETEYVYFYRVYTENPNGLVIKICYKLKQLYTVCPRRSDPFK